MKFGTTHRKGEAVLIARFSDSEAIALADAREAAGRGAAPQTMRALLSAGSVELKKRMIQSSQPKKAARPASRVMAQTGRLALRDPSKLIGVAMNRRDCHYDPRALHALARDCPSMERGVGAL